MQPENWVLSPGQPSRATEKMEEKLLPQPVFTIEGKRKDPDDLRKSPGEELGRKTLTIDRSGSKVNQALRDARNNQL